MFWKLFINNIRDDLKKKWNSIISNTIYQPLINGINMLGELIISSNIANKEFGSRWNWSNIEVFNNAIYGFSKQRSYLN